MVAQMVKNLPAIIVVIVVVCIKGRGTQKPLDESERGE